MSRDLILSDDGGGRYSFENLRTQGWLDGHAPGLEAGAVWLNDQATELFKKGDHEAAIKMQKLSREMVAAVKPVLEASAKRHEKEHPYQLEEGE